MRSSQDYCRNFVVSFTSETPEAFTIKPFKAVKETILQLAYQFSLTWAPVMTVTNQNCFKKVGHLSVCKQSKRVLEPSKFYAQTVVSQLHDTKISKLCIHNMAFTDSSFPPMRLCQPPDGSTSPKYKLLCFIITKKNLQREERTSF